MSHSSVLPVTQIGTATKGFNLKPSLEPPYIMGRQDGLGMLESQQWEERRGWQSPKSLRAHPCISPLCKNQRVSAPCTLEKDPRPGPLFEGNPVGEGTTEGLLKLPCIVQKNTQVLHTARQVECHPMNNSIGKHRTLANLITWTTALSNSVKL